MSNGNYIGFDKAMKDALVAARGQNTISSPEDKLRALERKLETAKLSQAEIAEIQKQIKQLKGQR